MNTKHHMIGIRGVSRTVVFTALFLVTTGWVAAGGSPETAAFIYDDLQELEINAGIFDVVVAGGSGRTVAVNVHDVPQGFRVDDRRRGGRATVDIRGRNTWFSRVAGDPRVVVSLPSGTDLDIETASGDVEVSNVRGVVRLRSASGTVAVQTIGGELSVRTASGNVEGRDVTGAVAVATASGNVELQAVRGTIGIETASGSIDVRELRLVADLELHSSSGDIDVDVENDLDDLRYELSSASGVLRFGTTRAERSLSGGEGRFRVEITTASGNITVR